MDITQMILTALILTAGSFFQSMVGFGFAMLSTPLLLLIDYTLAEAIMLQAPLMLGQSTLGTLKLKDHIPWKPVWHCFALRTLFLPVGVWCLAITQESWSPLDIERGLGCVLLGTITLQLLARPKPKDHLNPLWGVLSFTSSGFLNGICGIGGPPLVLWVMAHNWINAQMRSFLFVSFTLGLPVNIALLFWKFGTTLNEALYLALCLIPLGFLGTHLGLKAGQHLPVSKLRKTAYVVLSLLGLYLLSGIKHQL